MSDRQSVIDRALAALNEIVNLRVITIQGTVDTTSILSGEAAATGNISIEDELPPVRIKPAVVVASSIDLVQGDIRNFLPDDYFTDQRRNLREFHAAQIALAREVMEKNVGTLVSVVERLTGTGTQPTQTGTGGQSTS